LLLLLDNFDSFTFNLEDYFLQLGMPCIVYRNDTPLHKILLNKYKGIILSPGPGIPKDAGIMMELIDFYHKKLPMLGICLGHQAIAEYFGAKIKKGASPMHGMISEITCDDNEIFQNIPTKINVVRYHSIIVDSLPSQLTCLAQSSEAEIMAFKHSSLPIFGLQFHPEAALTEYGMEILKNWLKSTKIRG
jgi:anthranilate synthase/aminodeoxychorismate synthase-like glutamine amidotransferase